MAAIQSVRPQRVLVVEDEPSLRVLISDVLAHEGGFDVVEAGSGDEALIYLRTEDDIDCVFTDVRMPGQYDGLALTTWIQGHMPRTKVLMTSGNLNPRERLADVAFLPKPYDLVAVIDRIRQLLH